MTHEVLPNDPLLELLEQCLVQSKPGRYLKNLRESQGLTLESVAQETLIPIKKLQSLEEDDYSELSGDAYIVAYIRKYGRILAVDTDPIVSAFRSTQEVYEHQNPSEESTEASTSSRPSLGMQFSAIFEVIPVKWMFAGLLLIWLVVAFLLGGDEKTLEGDIEEVVVSDVMVDGDTEVEGSELEEGAIVEEPVEQQLEAVVLPGSNMSEVDVIEEPVDGSFPKSTQKSLVISFYGDSWVAVKDVKGQQLIAQLKRKGDNLQLFGEAPFSVMLGDARSVELVFDGVVVDTTPPSNRRTLRLQVGE